MAACSNPPPQDDFYNVPNYDYALPGPFVHAPGGIVNMQTGETVVSAEYNEYRESRGINSEHYFGFTAKKDGCWYFVELAQKN